MLQKLVGPTHEDVVATGRSACVPTADAPPSATLPRASLLLFLRGDLRLGGLEVGRIVSADSARVVARLFQLGQFGAHLCAGDRSLVALRERQRWSGDGAEDEGESSKRFHDVYLLMRIKRKSIVGLLY